MSTSNASLALSLAASLAAAPLSIFPTISASSMRPCAKRSPFRNTVGTPMISRASISFWNTPPSMAVCVMRGLSALIRLSACTTSGQLWQLRE